MTTYLTRPSPMPVQRTSVRLPTYYNWQYYGSTVAIFMGSIVTRLIGLIMTPFDPTIAKGLSIQMTCMGTYSNNDATQNLTSVVTWTTGDSSIATITNAGVLTAVDLGTCSIVATYLGVTTQLSVTVITATLSAVSVTPVNQTVAKGLTQQYEAIGFYTDSSESNLTGTATWASTVPGVATIVSGGLATVVAATSSTTIQATSGSTTGSTSLTASAAVLVSIAVTPSIPIVGFIAVQNFTATGTYTDGSTANLTGSATWASSDTSVATINSSGVATTGSTSGSSNITATVGSIVGTTAIVAQDIVAPILISVTSSGGQVSLNFNIPVANSSMVGSWVITGGDNITIANVSVTGITSSGSSLLIATTEQTAGSSYVLSFPAGAIQSGSGFNFLGPYVQPFTGVGYTTPITVVALNSQAILVTFARPVNVSQALNPVNYSLSPSVAIFSVSQVTATQYQVITGPQAYGTPYTLTVSNVQDLAFNFI